MLPPPPVIAEMPAVVAPQNDNRIRGEAEAIEFVKHLANLGIDKTDGSMVAMNHGPRLIIAQRAGLGNVAVLPQLAPVARRISGRTDRRGAQLGHSEGCAIVKVPIFLRRTKWQMRLEKSDGEKKWLARFFSRAAQTPDRFLCNFPIGI